MLVLIPRAMMLLLKPFYVGLVREALRLPSASAPHVVRLTCLIGLTAGSKNPLSLLCNGLQCDSLQNVNISSFIHTVYAAGDSTVRAPRIGTAAIYRL